MPGDRQTIVMKEFINVTAVPGLKLPHKGVISKVPCGIIYSIYRMFLSDPVQREILWSWNIPDYECIEWRKSHANLHLPV